jgi:DNA invertase Pin-like site-specific DNA recombinase
MGAQRRRSLTFRGGSCEKDTRRRPFSTSRISVFAAERKNFCIDAAALLELAFFMKIPDAQSSMIYGYARLSTAAQDETGQVRQLKAAGCEKVFREKITGTTADRPQLAKLMKALAPGDVVITPAVDRLSRDTTDLLVIARDMQRAGAGIRSLAEPFLDTTSDFAEIIFAILGVAAKLERRRILERTARGRADAKANGVKFGRKPILTPHQQKEARQRLEAGETQRSVARSYNVSQSTISRLSP